MTYGGCPQVVDEDCFINFLVRSYVLPDYPMTKFMAGCPMDAQIKVSITATAK